MVPPKSMIFIGDPDGDFLQEGREFEGYLREFCALKPNHRVLDVGCGIGRMAIPLTRFLGPEGEYVGLDIVRKGIQWCRQAITSEYPNFRFIHINVFNKHYNPDGGLQSQEYSFPFQEEQFDIVFLTSVFTHMLPDGLERYISEISRVMRPDGKALITFFLLNEESLKLIQSGKSDRQFKFEMDGFRTTNASNPEAAIAYPEDDVLRLFEANNLSIDSPIKRGSWCGREEYVSYQDIIVATKR